MGYDLDWKLDLGASIIRPGLVHFRIWAPLIKELSVRTTTNAGIQLIPLVKDERGYFEGVASDVFSLDRYTYVCDKAAIRADPASRYQPDGVHGPSQIIDPQEFIWHDDEWRGRRLKEFVIYEIHVGTFSMRGTFDSIIDYIDYLSDLGITALELMPIGQFVGSKNWGYDGIYPFAPQNTYGGPEGLKRLIDICHGKGMAVILDVVNNHLGPEGCYLGDFGPYFTDRYKTPWGNAINFDGPFSDQVRHYFISNALYWIIEYHVDALRIDAIQGIVDFRAHHFLAELASMVNKLRESLDRSIYLIAESDLNDVRVINEPDIGGYGLDAQWNDDFHHALHSLVTGEKRAYYGDFGELAQMGKALSDGFVYSGQYSPTRKHGHGSCSRERPPLQFVVFSQNHDQAGNEMARPDYRESLEQLKLKAAMVILSPYIPLLFMGEEYAETAPFHYFVDHEDPDLIEAVRKARNEEFMALWQKAPADPEADKTFLDSKIGLHRPRSTEQEQLLDFYRTLIKLRKEIPVLANPLKKQIEVTQLEDEKTLVVHRWRDQDNILCFYSFNQASVLVKFAIPKGRWLKVIDSSSRQWGGLGQNAPELIESTGMDFLISLDHQSFILYRQAESETINRTQ